ncbi:MAG: hypothetical protein IPL53_11910 [Ignavibacteria bacterium]|nr:hypothetical protein [Ignavibacteria bacterium]
MIDVRNLNIKPNTVKKIHRLVDTYRIKLNGDLPTLYVKLFQNSENKFYVVPNYFIGTDSSRANVYDPRYYESEELALNQVFTHGLQNFNPGSMEQKIERNDMYFEDSNIDMFETSF